MQRLFFAFAAATVLSLTAGSALAQGLPPGYSPGPPPGYAGGIPPGYAPGPPPGYGEQMYGGSVYGGYMGGGYGGHMVHGGYGKLGLGGTGLLSGIFTNHHMKEKGLFGGGGNGRSGETNLFQDIRQGARNLFGDEREQRIRNAQTLPTAQGGGTLVYPQNPFVRSPRDFFMWDEK